MVSINDVYQKVLALANKEQRGYITPQEFNLFADQAQQEIFEQYFYDLNQFSRVPGNNTEYSDMVGLIDEKLSVLKRVDSFTPNSGFVSRTDFGDIYKIGTVVNKTNNVEIEEVNENELLYINLSPLAKPTTSRPIYTSRKDGLHILPSKINSIKINYIRKPSKPTWGYEMVSEKALYNLNDSNDFELHYSEESELVYRILALAGLAIQKPELTQTAAALQGAKVQQEKQ